LISNYLIAEVCVVLHFLLFLEGGVTCLETKLSPAALVVNVDFVGTSASLYLFAHFVHQIIDFGRS